MVYSFQEGLKALQELAKSLAGYQQKHEPLIDVYNKNQEQLKKLGEVSAELQDPQNPNRGLIPGLERAKRNAISQNEGAVLDAYVDSADALAAIKEIGKNYIQKAKGGLQKALVAIFGYLNVQYKDAKGTAQTVANTPVMKPKIAKKLGTYNSILK